MKRIAVLTALMIVAMPLVGYSVEPPKDPNPGQASDNGIPNEATGGPDAFGYTFADTAEPNCAYQFVDITATGTNIVSGDDVSSGAVALGAPFDIYGISNASLNMASNGYLTTDGADGGPDLSPDCPLPAVPSTPGGTPGARFYPLHDDLITDAGLVEYFAACPRPNANCVVSEDCTIFQWNTVTHFGGGGPWNMQAILYHQSGDFVFQIGAGNPELGSASTTGIQAYSPPTTGLTYACDTANSVPDDTGVCFFHPNPAPACAGIATVAIPTANNFGLLALLIGLAVAAFFMLRRRFA